MTLVAEIVGVGTELLLGNITNTNAQMISEGLSGLGINVYFHTVVGDNPERLKSAVSIARERADIIITTGGLGPTCDDLTKQTIAECFDKKLIFREETAEQIRSYFRDRLLVSEIPQNNMLQAMLPEGCEVFENSWGTAPGCAFESGGKHVIMLPGPPNECGAMFRDCAIPYLKKLSDSAIVSSSVKIFGMGESAVEEKLHDMMVEMTNPTVAPYAKSGEVRLRVTGKAETEEKAKKMIIPVIEEIKKTLGSIVYGIDVDSLEEMVLQLLSERGMTLAVAESCTGGLVAKRLTDVPGSSAAFKGGVIAYTNEIKTNCLEVPQSVIDQYGVISAPVAEAMAAGIQRIFGSDLGIGITGLAGPSTQGSPETPGTVFVALASGEKQWCRSLKLGDGRGRIRIMAANHALDMVRRYLTGIEIVGL